jgi:hypothetical protein
MAESKYQHIMRIQKYNYAIEGLKIPFEGRGGAQFANHHRDKHNSIIRVKHQSPDAPRWEYYGIDALNPQCKLPLLQLIAIKNIDAGQEIFWVYPNNSLVRCGIDEEAELPTGLSVVYPGQDDAPLRSTKRSREEHGEEQGGRVTPMEADDTVELSSDTLSCPDSDQEGQPSSKKVRDEDLPKVKLEDEPRERGSLELTPQPTTDLIPGILEDIANAVQNAIAPAQ